VRDRQGGERRDELARLRRGHRDLMVRCDSNNIAYARSRERREAGGERHKVRALREARHGLEERRNDGRGLERDAQRLRFLWRHGDAVLGKGLLEDGSRWSRKMGDVRRQAPQLRMRRGRGNCRRDERHGWECLESEVDFARRRLVEWDLMRVKRLLNG